MRSAGECGGFMGQRDCRYGWGAGSSGCGGASISGHRKKRRAYPRDCPRFAIPDRLFYVKPEVGGIAIGGWESNTLPFASNGMPPGFGRELLESNFERFEQIIVQAAERMPILNELGVQTLINGPIPVSPDGEPIMGPVPELDNMLVACGFTAGIAGSGGAGKAIAEWIVEGEPEFDIWAFDVRRFGPHHSTRQFLAERRC